MKKLPIVSIVGRPNVGKSTLFNRLVQKRQAIVAKEEGTTRDSVSNIVHWDRKNFVLVDTAGLIVDFYGFKEAEIEKKAQLKIDEALAESDLIVFVVDLKQGIVSEDEEVARKLRKYEKKVILVANKADSMKNEEELNNLKKIGFDTQIAISALSGRRTGDLLDLITKDIKEEPIERDNSLRMCLIGRPNVGKSTLFNELVGKDTAIVSDIAGTTRDSIKFTISVDFSKRKRLIEIIDTAGFRRRGKIEVGIEKFSVLRSIETILQSNLVLILTDAVEGFTRMDAHLVEFARKKHKQVIVVVNKIDLLKEPNTELIPNFYRFLFINREQIVAISAKDKQNIELLKKAILNKMDEVNS